MDKEGRRRYLKWSQKNEKEIICSLSQTSNSITEVYCTMETVKEQVFMKVIFNWGKMYICKYIVLRVLTKAYNKVYRITIRGSITPQKSLVPLYSQPFCLLTAPSKYWCVLCTYTYAFPKMSYKLHYTGYNLFCLSS